MPREQRSQQVPLGESDVEDEEREMALAHNPYHEGVPSGVRTATGDNIGTFTVPGSPESINSQLVITLYEGEREPHLLCTKAGRMTGQMVMGLEGAGMMKIDNVLRAAQLELRRKAGQMTPQNMKTIEDRLMQTKENSGG